MLAALLCRARALFAGPAPAPAPQPPSPLPALWAAGHLDIADFSDCPRENRRTPHAMRADGSRRCFRCGHETPGQDS
ncbi:MULTISPECIES: hypothetical protein [Streptomyces]|uniref:Zinc finger CHC2-type domain-containing protein n=1 Tax=Streptomyces canarius TaxID=285453 RepID=A0ABQ3CEY3_9ACTN|nr:hypothetical protein [Streptomyces canarius]GHA08526.1 hypothetical protein GCM10010345_11090 [Streptomyces canarius]